MDPVTVGAVLVAIAGGAGSELAARLWAGVSALVRRPFRHPPCDAGRACDAELAALEQAPADEGRAVALAEVLVARAGSDAQFRQALEGWWGAGRADPDGYWGCHEHDQRRQPAGASAAGPGLHQYHLLHDPARAAGPAA